MTWKVRNYFFLEMLCLMKPSFPVFLWSKMFQILRVFQNCSTLEKIFLGTQELSGPPNDKRNSPSFGSKVFASLMDMWTTATDNNPMPKSSPLVDLSIPHIQETPLGPIELETIQTQLQGPIAPLGSSSSDQPNFEEISSQVLATVPTFDTLVSRKSTRVKTIPAKLQDYDCNIVWTTHSPSAPYAPSDLSGMSFYPITHFVDYDQIFAFTSAFFSFYYCRNWTHSIF